MPQQPSRTYTTDPEEIAAALEEVSGKILDLRPAALVAPVTVSVILHVSAVPSDDVQRAAVDQLNAITGGAAAHLGTEGEYASYQTSHSGGLVTLMGTAFVRRPVTEVERLKAEVEQLRAQLAEQAAQAVADVVDQDDDCTCLEIDGYHTCGTTINAYADPAVRRAIAESTGGAR